MVPWPYGSLALWFPGSYASPGRPRFGTGGRSASGGPLCLQVGRLQVGRLQVGRLQVGRFCCQVRPEPRPDV